MGAREAIGPGVQAPDQAAEGRGMRALLGMGLVALVAAAAPGPARGITLYDNGPVNDPSAVGRCDSGISFGCGGDGDWTFYDDFVVTGDATMTGFDYVDWFSSVGPANYVSTDWSLYDADPFVAAAIASGTAVASLTPTGPAFQYRFEVAGLSQALTSGVVYWLGISNNVTGNISTTAARVDDPGGGLNASKQADGAGNQLDFPGFENRAFRIEGTPVPEPRGALPILAVGAALLVSRRRG